MQKINVLVITNRFEDGRLPTEYFAGSTESTLFLFNGMTKGDTALKALCSNAYDVFLVDVSTKDQDTAAGIQLLKIAIAGGCISPVIFITDGESDTLEHEVDSAGGADCLPTTELTPVTLRRTIRYANKYFRRYTELVRRANDVQEQLRSLWLKYVK